MKDEIVMTLNVSMRVCCHASSIVLDKCSMLRLLECSVLIVDSSLWLFNASEIFQWLFIMDQLTNKIILATNFTFPSS